MVYFFIFLENKTRLYDSSCILGT